MASSLQLPNLEYPPSLDDADGEYEDEEGYEDAEGEYDDGEDLDAEAEAMARRLGDQLLADIAKAQAEAAAAVASASAPERPVESSAHPVVSPSTSQVSPVQQSLQQTPVLKKKQQAALVTIRGILALAVKHPVVGSTLSASQVSDAGGGNLLDVFNRCISTSVISKSLARALSEAVLTLAKSEVLFGSLRNSDAAAIQLDKGKRKRDQTDEGGRLPELTQKRLAYAIPVDQPDLLGQISAALRAVGHALATMPPSQDQSRPINPAVISFIQYPLHQIFLFSVTSAPRAGQGRIEPLQELAGLVQMLGVLSGIHIGNPPPEWQVPPGGAPPPPPPDIGTAVYPCLFTGCLKTFHRLYSLRAHQRLHTLEHRPHRCTQCPASFVRNHDLKRHALLHDKKAWRCTGCNKIFSRRDAIKRHKDARSRSAGKARPGDADSLVDAACACAEIETVEVDKLEGDEAINRRGKLWDGIAAASTVGGCEAMGERFGPEEGEVNPGIVHEAQSMVLGMHAQLQGVVARALGSPATPSPTPPLRVSQTTLASIIARAQQQSSASPDPSTPAHGASAPADTVTPTLVSMEVEVGNAVSTDPGQATLASDEPLSSTTPLSLSWLSEEQTRLLEQAIAQASAAAQAQAEAEAALEEGEEYEEEEEEEEEVAAEKES